MKISMMSYTMGRGAWGKTGDAVELCRLTRRLGLDAIDWVTTHGNDPRHIRKVTDDFGLRNVCHTFFARLSSPQADERREAMDKVRAGLDVAGILGADKVMVVMGNQPDVTVEQARAWALEGLTEAVALGGAAGITVTIEHFPGAQSPFVTSADMNAAIRAVPGLKITYDNGNVITAGEDPADGFRNSSEHVVHAHFKDWEIAEDGLLGRDGRCYRGALIGEGIVDPVPCLEAMHAAGYGGYINFEYEGDAYTPEEAMTKGVPLLADLIDRVQAAKA